MEARRVCCPLLLHCLPINCRCYLLHRLALSYTGLPVFCEVPQQGHVIYGNVFVCIQSSSRNFCSHRQGMEPWQFHVPLPSSDLMGPWNSQAHRTHWNVFPPQPRSDVFDRVQPRKLLLVHVCFQRIHVNGSDRRGFHGKDCTA